MSDFSVMFSEETRFDHRQLHVNSDGDDFEAFVFECFAAADAEQGLERSLSKGRDGAIDLASFDGPERCVIECKFIGEGVSSSPLDRWREVKNRLVRNLPALANGDEKGRVNYRPWLDTDFPIANYNFCISSLGGTVGNQDGLRQQVSKDFQSLSTMHPRLAHLASVKVQVFTWDHFHGVLQRNAPLRFRWFGGLPTGLSTPGGQITGTNTFKRFLDDDILPYFSRANFAAESQKGGEVDERAWVDALDTVGNMQAALLFGPGGVGKTRLGVELCRWLQERGWLALKVDRAATADSIEALLQSHAQSARIVFLLDYAEAARNVHMIVDAVRQAAERDTHVVRLIATCRSSAFSFVLDALADLKTQVIGLSGDHGDGYEDTYSRWVVKKILEHGSVPRQSEVERVCDGLPVLAAFAVFLYAREPNTFETQFSQLLGVRDFSAWATKRIGILVADRPDQNSALEALADLAFQLPMPGPHVTKIMDSNGEKRVLLEKLVADHWVEPDGESYVAAHDVFGDALVFQHVFKMPGLETARLSALFRRAFQEGHVDTSFVIVDRLASHPDFEKVDGLSVANSLLEHDRSAALASVEALISGRLLTSEQIIRLLAKERDVRDSVADNRGTDGRISYLAEYVAETEPEDPIRTVAPIALDDILDRSVSFPNPSNMILRRAYIYDPQKFLSKVQATANDHSASEQTQYLLVAMLRKGVAPKDLTVLVDTWLDVYATKSRKASFVLQAWLDAGGECEAVAGHVEVWLEEHEALLEAAFVYRAWLGAGGECEAIAGHVSVWLREHEALLEAHFVYSAWLYASGDCEAVAEPVAAWLKAHETRLEARSVYCGWLSAGGGCEAVAEPIMAWLKVHEVQLEAGFVYRAWLDASGGCDSVAEPVAAWLKEHDLQLPAGFVYRAWLDSGGGCEAVAEHVVAWLDEHASAFGMDYVVRAWLEADGDVETVKESAFKWLHTHWQRDDAVFITKTLSQLAALPDQTIVDIANWAWTHYRDPDALFRVSRVSNFLNGDFVDSPDGVRDAVVRASWMVLGYRLRSGNWEEERSRYSAGLLLILLIRWVGNVPRYGPIVEWALAVYISEGKTFVRGSGLRFVPILLVLLKRCLYAGYLDPESDRRGLSRFIEWVRDDSDEYGEISEILDRMSEDYEAEFWSPGEAAA